MKIKDVPIRCGVCGQDNRLRRDYWKRLAIRCDHCGHEVLLERKVGDIDKEDK